MNAFWSSFDPLLSRHNLADLWVMDALLFDLSLWLRCESAADNRWLVYYPDLTDLARQELQDWSDMLAARNRAILGSPLDPNMVVLMDVLGRAYNETLEDIDTPAKRTDNRFEFWEAVDRYRARTYKDGIAYVSMDIPAYNPLLMTPSEGRTMAIEHLKANTPQHQERAERDYELLFGTEKAPVFTSQDPFDSLVLFQVLGHNLDCIADYWTQERNLTEPMSTRAVQHHIARVAKHAKIRRRSV